MKSNCKPAIVGFAVRLTVAAAGGQTAARGPNRRLRRLSARSRH
jgi:hypothetical protein